MLPEVMVSVPLHTVKTPLFVTFILPRVAFPLNRYGLFTDVLLLLSTVPVLQLPVAVEIVHCPNAEKLAI
jgi:hypothetical protein